MSDSACRIPTEAEDDWITAVSTAPAITPRKGLEKAVIRLVNCGMSFSGATAPLIISMPNISTEKPSRMADASFFFCFLVDV